MPDFVRNFPIQLFVRSLSRIFRNIKNPEFVQLFRSADHKIENHLP
ncbi:hypothetical protein [Chlorogloeopsis fritschii]|nr:hypothetical protein [Chlorogloeopsis fritschii]